MSFLFFFTKMQCETPDLMQLTNFTTHTPHSPFQIPIPSLQYTQSHYSSWHATYSLSYEPCHTNTTSKAYSPPLPPHHPNQYSPQLQRPGRSMLPFTQRIGTSSFFLPYGNDARLVICVPALEDRVQSASEVFGRTTEQFIAGNRSSFQSHRAYPGDSSGKEM